MNLKKKHYFEPKVFSSQNNYLFRKEFSVGIADKKCLFIVHTFFLYLNSNSFLKKNRFRPINFTPVDSTNPCRRDIY